MVNTDSTIREWVGLYTEALFKRAMCRISDEELAKDLVQDTFMAAYQGINSFKHNSNPKTWLTSILNYKIADHYRKQFRNPVKTHINDEPAFFDQDGMWHDDKKPQKWNCDMHLLDDQAFLKVLNSCMGKLPPLWSAALHLKYFSEKDGADAGNELNISKSNFWQMVHRAKLNLRECLDINWFKQ